MPFALERTQLLRDDSDWLPPSLKLLRWGVAGAFWTATAAVLVPRALPDPLLGQYAKTAVGVVLPSAVVAGHRAASALLRRRLPQLADHDVPLREIRGLPDGARVHSIGRVRARATLPAILTEAPVVYRRLVVQLGDAELVHEAAVDFSLVDGGGEEVWLRLAEARLIPRAPRRFQLNAFGDAGQRIAQLPLPPRVRDWVEARRAPAERGQAYFRMIASEALLRDGDEVAVLGVKARTVDPAIERLERETPLRAILRGGHALPLLVAPR